MTDSERWNRIQELFLEALEMSEAERADFLRDLKDRDSALYSEVHSLLEADSGEDSLIDGRVIDIGSADDEPAEVGSRIGPYRIVDRIGSGGMGEVYLAERADGVFEQRVALKVVKRGMDTAEILGRFEAERQILARLDHPNIAHLIDGGETEDGRPFFSLQYVEGESIDTYCNSRKLSVDDRLRLFESVLDAVSYAHQNLVVHRDLKPSNIMVSEDGTVKLVDFGIAKIVVGSSGEAASNLTRTGARIMTPIYASPEQVKGEPVSTSADVYSLGVVLYELLTGHHPYDVRRDSMQEMERAIISTEPSRPSNRVSDDGERDQIHEPRLKSRLRGDLDNICLKVLRKSPADRYHSADQFAEDIRRHLNNEPILAAPPGVASRIRKFVLRNRVAVASGTVVLLALIVGLAMATYGFVQARNERDRARSAAAKAEAVSSFLEEVFEVSDPFTNLGERITARELLDRGAARIEDELAGEPEIQSTMYATVGRLYRSLGLYFEAEPFLEKRLETSRELYGDHSVETAGAYNELGILEHYLGNFDTAAAMHGAALERLADLMEPGAVRIADVYRQKGIVAVSMTDYALADSLFRRALEIYESRFGPRSRQVAEVMGDLGTIGYYTGDYEWADSAYQAAIEIYEETLGPHRPELFTVLQNQGISWQVQGRLTDADSLFRDLLERKIVVYGDRHTEVASALHNIGSVLQYNREYDSALVVLGRTLEIFEESLGPNHDYVAFALRNIGRCQRYAGKTEESIASMLRSTEIIRRVHGEKSKRMITSYSMLGNSYADAGYLDSAEICWLKGMAIDREYNGEGYNMVTDYNNLAGGRAEQGDNEGAAMYYLKALDLAWRTCKGDTLRVTSQIINVGLFYQGIGELEESEKHMRKAFEIRESLPDGDWRKANMRSLYGNCLARLGQDSRAESLMVAAYDMLEELEYPQNPGLIERRKEDARKRVFNFYESRGQADVAAQYLSPAEASN